MMQETPTSTSSQAAASQALAALDDSLPLTRVSLLYIERRINLYLRFGCPMRVHQIDRWRRCAVFPPAQLFCRIRWESNDYGTRRWQLMVLQSGRPEEGMQRVRGIRPGARILLNAEGEHQVRAVLARIDAIETQVIAPTEVSPAYWRLLHNRLAARQPLPDYDADRHAAWLAGRALQ